METFDGSLSTRYEKVYGIVNIREPKAQNGTSWSSATRAFGVPWNLSTAQYHEILNSCSQTQYSNLEIHCRPTRRLFPTTFPQPWRVNINVTRSTDSEAVELPIIGFNIVIYHCYDAEVDGPLKGHLKDTFKKGRVYPIKTDSPKKLQTVSVLSQSSRLVSVQNEITENPATSPNSHHVATEMVEEFTPFCAAASSNGALPTLSCLSERYRKQRTSRRRTRYGHRHTGMDCIVSRIRRSRLGTRVLEVLGCTKPGVWMAQGRVSHPHTHAHTQFSLCV